jgi:hypothetical protein
VNGALERYWESVTSYENAIRRTKSVNINRSDVRDSGKSLVGYYFREVRPALVHAGVGDSILSSLDASNQTLLRLCNGSNLRRSHLTVIRTIRARQTEVVIACERAISESVAVETEGALSRDEVLILRTLKGMMPATAASYEQALIDLSGKPRLSYRGVAVDLRECLREVLDHLAPDKEVMGSVDYKNEPNRETPTMAQKARHILKARRVGANAVRSLSDTLSLVDGLAGNLVRTIYSRGSGAVHAPPSRAEVQELRMNVDAALAALLGIFSLPA